MTNFCLITWWGMQLSYMPAHEVELIKRWFDRGVSIRETAALTGADRGTVFRYFRKWREGSDVRPRSFPNKQSGRFETTLTLETKGKWVEEAKKRDIPLQRLIQEIADAVANDDLFSAILDG